MRRRVAMVAALIALAITGLTGCSNVPEPPKTTFAAPALVVVTDPLEWAEVTPDEMPFLSAMLDDAAAGMVVSRNPESSPGMGVLSPAVALGTPAEIDNALAEAVAAAAPGTPVIVVSRLTGARPGHGAYPGVVVVSGGGYGPGLLTSNSTRRDGVVTDVDVEATARRIADPAAEWESGTPAAVVADDRTPVERVAWLTRVSVFLGSAEEIRVPTFNIYTAAMVVLLLAGWFVAERCRSARRYTYWSIVLRRMILLGLVLPVGATLLHVVDRFPESPERIVGLMLAATGFVWIFSEFAWRKLGIAGALAFAGLAAALVLGIDQITGAELSLSSLFSYSPLVGFRFFGIGNEGAAILVGGALVGVALEIDAVRLPSRVRRGAIAATGAFAVIVCAAPILGANVIVSVWGTIAFAALLIAAERRPVRRADIAVTAVLTFVALGAMVALDRLAGGTHIGRAVGDVADGGLLEILTTRLATSVRIFTDSPLPAIVLIISAGLAYLRFAPRGRMAVVFERYPVFAAAVWAGLIGGFVGAVVEDSGVVVLALIVTYLVGALVALMLETDKEAGGR